MLVMACSTVVLWSPSCCICRELIACFGCGARGWAQAVKSFNKRTRREGIEKSIQKNRVRRWVWLLTPSLDRAGHGDVPALLFAPA